MVNSRYTSVIFIVLFALFSLPKQMLANEIEAIQIKVAAPSIHPYVYLDEQDVAQGSLVNLFNKVTSNSNLSVEIFVMPWARALKEVELGRMDAIMPAIHTLEREQFLVYPKVPLISFNAALLKRKADTRPLEALANLTKDRIIAKNRATRMGTVFDKAEAEGSITIIEVLDFDSAINMLNQEKVDYVACTESICQSSLQRLGLVDELEMVVFDGSVENSYFAFSKQFSAKNNVDVIMNTISQFNTENLHE